MRDELWFSEDKYYTKEQVSDMLDNDNFGSPFISTKMTRENWYEWSRVQVCCKDRSVRTFVKLNKEDVETLFNKIKGRLDFLNGDRDEWNR